MSKRDTEPKKPETEKQERFHRCQYGIGRMPRDTMKSSKPLGSITNPGGR